MRGPVESIVIIALVCGVASVVIAALNTKGHARCELRWKDSGLHAEFRRGAGCLVEISPGRWVPEENVRPYEITNGAKQ